MDKNKNASIIHTPQHYLFYSSRVSKDLFRFLLESGADVNIPDASGNTCLHHIAEKGLYKLFPIISELIESGRIKLQLLRNSQNFTPLLASLYNVDKRMTEFLLEHCDLTVPTVRQCHYLNIICSEKKYIYRKRMRRTLVTGVKHGMLTGRVEHGYLMDEFCDAEKLSDIHQLTVTAVKLLINSYFYRDVSVGMLALYIAEFICSICTLCIGVSPNIILMQKCNSCCPLLSLM